MDMFQAVLKLWWKFLQNQHSRAFLELKFDQHASLTCHTTLKFLSISNSVIWATTCHIFFSYKFFPLPNPFWHYFSHYLFKETIWSKNDPIKRSILSNMFKLPADVYMKEIKRTMKNGKCISTTKINYKSHEIMISEW